MVEFTVPISINPYIRKGMLEDWPEPLTIPHHEVSYGYNAMK